MTASFLGEDYLEIRDLTVDFDGFKAIHDVDVTFQQGRLHFLIGPNGAGKTTLVDALTGLVQGHRAVPSSANRNLLEMKSHKIVRLGIGRTFQTATVFEQLSVLQNLDIAAGCTATRPGCCSARRQGARVGGAGAGDDRPDRPWPTGRPGSSPTARSSGSRSACCWCRTPQVMFLDETVAGMSAEEREETGDLLERIVADRTIVVIEHDMDFMRRYADFVTVMHAGTVLAEGTVAEIQADPQVQYVYLGTVAEVVADA